MAQKQSRRRGYTIKTGEFLIVVAILGWIGVIAFMVFDRAEATEPVQTSEQYQTIESAVVSSRVELAAVADAGTAVVAAAVPTEPKKTDTQQQVVPPQLSTDIAEPTPVPTHTNTATATASSTPTDTPTPTPTLTQTPSATPTKTATPTNTTTPVPIRGLYPYTATPAQPEELELEAIPTPVPLVSVPMGTINLVLLGSDKRPHETSWRTDVVIIVSINPNLPTVTMWSIPRDTWLYVPNWTYQRVNLADTHGAAVGYPGGGPGLVKATIEYNFGVHIDYYARVDFAGLMRIVDTLGGVDVLLDCPVEDGFPDDPITEDPSVVTQISYPEPGFYNLDGKHALWLARSRKTTSEFARSRRQHQILKGIWAKANQLGLVTRLPELWEELSATVQTDLSLDDMVWLASIGLQMDPTRIRSGFIDGSHLTSWTTPKGANVLLPHTEEILAELEPLLNPYPYQAPQGFNLIDVWNGSGRRDWDLLATDKLLRNGFVVTSMQPADAYYEQTAIVDYTTTPKGSPLPLIQRLFNVPNANVISQPDPNSPVQFRLIVGASYQPCVRPRGPVYATPTPAPPTETPSPMPGG